MSIQLTSFHFHRSCSHFEMFVFQIRKDQYDLCSLQGLHTLLTFQMTWESYEHHFDNCVPFEIDKKCFESNDAHLSMNRNVFIIMVVVNFTLIRVL